MKKVTKVSELNFDGQTIYTGIDVHKNRWKVTHQVGEVVYQTYSQDACVKTLLKYLKRNFPGAAYKAAYEAGFSGFWLQKALVKQGIDCIVVHPADIPTTDKEKRQKTDKRDSLKIAKALYHGQLEGIYVHSDEGLCGRQLVRLRQKLARNLTASKNYLTSNLHFWGIPKPEDCSKWSKSFVCWLKELKLEHASGDTTIQIGINRLEMTKSMIQQTNSQIRKLAKTPRYQEKARLLTSVPGIGLLTAMIILTELEDIHRFKSLDHLCAYFGLIPNTNQSGERPGVGEMTHRGNGFLKTALVESTWVAIRKDPALTRKYNELVGKNKMKANKAIIRIAKKLLNRIRYVLINEQPYQNLVVQ